MSINTRRWIITALAAALVLLSAILLNIAPAAQTGFPVFEPGSDNPAELPADVDEAAVSGQLKIALSHPEHFYGSNILVSITASITDAKIYYTLDGAEPTVESDEYTGPLLMEAPEGNRINAVTLKAISEYAGVITRPMVHTYFLGHNVLSRFDTPVISLSTDSDYLYDYDTGIFVEGQARADYIEANPGTHIVPPDPANFNWRGMEGERPVYVEIFLPTGERALAQAAGLRVHGGWSRAVLQKSIRLIARNEYEPGQGKFHFDLFPDDLINDGYGTPLRKFDQIVLRNGANDRDFAMIRNEVGNGLARIAGLRTAPAVRAVSIFLNGEYYGFAWAQTRVNAQYLQDIYSAPAREFQVVGNGELWIETDDTEEREAIEHLNSFYFKDLTNDEVFAELEALVDIDDLIVYYALETYLGNHDWPNNNLKRWRYTGPQEEGLAPELDGRWRYVVFDLDWILGLYEENPNVNRPTFQEMLNTRNDRYSFMLNALLKRPDMADKFAIAMCDIAANIVTVRNVDDLIGKLYGEAFNEIGFALSTSKYAGWVSRDSIRFNHTNMLKVAEGRSGYIFRSLREFFEWEDSMFSVEVTGSDAYIGTQIGRSSRYFDHLTIPLRPVPPEYSVFDHWILNGTAIYTPEITVSLADAVNGVVRVELVTREEFPVLVFKEAYGSSAGNGCTLYNPGPEEVRTDGLYMTNDLANPYLWALPEARVAPGGILEFAGRGSRETSDLHKIKMGFNARSGRMLYLCNESGEVLSRMIVS